VSILVLPNSETSGAGMMRGTLSAPHDQQLSTMFTTPAIAPGRGFFHQQTVKRVDAGRTLCASLSTTSDGRTGRGLCATCPLHRGLETVDPSSIRSSIRCARENRSNSAQSSLQTSTGWRALCASSPSHPGDSLLLSPGLPLYTPSRVREGAM